MCTNRTLIALLRFGTSALISMTAECDEGIFKSRLRGTFSIAENKRRNSIVLKI